MNFNEAINQAISELEDKDKQDIVLCPDKDNPDFFWLSDKENTTKDRNRIFLKVGSELKQINHNVYKIVIEWSEIGERYENHEIVRSKDTLDPYSEFNWILNRNKSNYLKTGFAVYLTDKSENAEYTGKYAGSDLGGLFRLEKWMTGFITAQANPKNAELLRFAKMTLLSEGECQDELDRFGLAKWMLNH